MAQVTNPPDPHDNTIDGWVSFMQGTLVKTLLDIASTEPNPAQAARHVLNDIQSFGDQSSDGIVLAALNQSASLIDPPA